MKKRDFLKAGAGTAAALAALPAAAQSKGPSYNWKMTTAWAGGPLMDIGAKAFAERLQFLSGGRMKIQVFPGGALGNPLKVSETVKNGVAEMGHTWMGYDWGADPTRKKQMPTARPCQRTAVPRPRFLTLCPIARPPPSRSRMTATNRPVGRDMYESPTASPHQAQPRPVRTARRNSHSDAASSGTKRFSVCRKTSW